MPYKRQLRQLGAMISSPLEESAVKSTQIQHDRAQMSSTNRAYTMPQMATNGHKTIIYYHKNPRLK